jgi:hypothetical protein
VLDLALRTAQSVAVLRRAKLHQQSLILIYSAIDTLAWARRPGGDVTRGDFCSWAKDYMSPATRLGCTPEDLYAARCGLVHSGAAQSRMSRRGETVELWYAVNDASVPRLEAFVKRKGVAAKVLSIPDLLEAFVDGAAAFNSAMNSDAGLKQTVTNRMRWWLGFVPTPPSK